MTLNRFGIGDTATAGEVGGGGSGNDEDNRTAIKAIGLTDKTHRWSLMHVPIVQPVDPATSSDYPLWYWQVPSGYGVVVDGGTLFVESFAASVSNCTFDVGFGKVDASGTLHDMDTTTLSVDATETNWSWELPGSGLYYSAGESIRFKIEPAVAGGNQLTGIHCALRLKMLHQSY